MEELIYLVIWLAKAAVKAYRKRQGHSGLPGGDAPEDVPPVVHPTDSLAAHAEAVAGAGRALSREARSFLAGTPQDPAERVLQDVARERVVAAADGAAEHAPRADLRQLDALGAGLQFHGRMLQALARMAGQREDATRRGLLRDVEAVAMALYGPLLESQRRRGFPLNTRQAVAFHGETPGSLSPLLARSAVAPVEVSVRLQHDVLAWPMVAREIGRDVVLSTDGMLEQIRSAADFPVPGSSFDAGFLTEEEVSRALAPWQLELCADAIAALIQGPAYLASLTALLRSPDQPYKVRLVELQNGRATARPPADLRVLVVAETLARVGFADEGGRFTEQWSDEHPLGMEFFYPTGGGRFAAVPEDLYVQPVRTLATVVCQHQLPSLAGMHLLDVPEFHHSLGRQRETARTVEELERGLRPSSADPRVIVAACTLAAREQTDLRARLLPILRGAIVGGADDTDAPVALRTRTAAEGWLDPQVIRDALVLQDVFARRGSPPG